MSRVVGTWRVQGCPLLNKGFQKQVQDVLVLEANNRLSGVMNSLRIGHQVILSSRIYSTNHYFRSICMFTVQLPHVSYNLFRCISYDRAILNIRVASGYGRTGSQSTRLPIIKFSRLNTLQIFLCSGIRCFVKANAY